MNPGRPTDRLFVAARRLVEAVEGLERGRGSWWGVAWAWVRCGWAILLLRWRAC